ncbi:nitrite reductase [Carboxydothermus islandicus]|uniref:Nitrite reductase n=1 Tax=Carboxydothermus islandicus TaxID=661089 RepID=A0A1L8D291_9THEO|nr:hypothetical protein [Carboxydothermus islandicus]GAV25269.1 nitrite reductase [Carboxydothermus islandicus]
MSQAVFKQRNGLVAVVLVTDCGVITPEKFKRLGEMIDEFGIKAFKLTTRQTLIVLLPEEKVEPFILAAGERGFKIGCFKEAVRNVKACSGSSELCPRALGEALPLGIKLQERFFGRPLKHDFKIAVAGCHRGCTDPYCADFGVIARGNNLFDIYIGGRGGSRKPVHGIRIAEKIKEDGIEEILEYILKTYNELAEEGERLCLTMDRVGAEKFIPTEIIEKYRERGEIIDQDFLKLFQGGK